MRSILVVEEFETMRTPLASALDEPPEPVKIELMSFVRGSDVQRSIPRLIVSTDASGRDRCRGIELRENGYLAKPSERRERIELVRDLIAQLPREA